MQVTPDIKTPAEHARLRAIVDAAAAYADSLMCDSSGKRVRNCITAEEAAAPVYAACSNAMRGRVEQYELLTNPPESFVAYVGADDESRRCIKTWAGDLLGFGYCLSTSRRYIGNRPPVFAYRFTMAGREYHGRGQGSGMCIYLRETAESKRKRESGK